MKKQEWVKINELKADSFKTETYAMQVGDSVMTKDILLTYSPNGAVAASETITVLPETVLSSFQGEGDSITHILLNKSDVIKEVTNQGFQLNHELIKLQKENIELKKIKGTLPGSLKKSEKGEE